MIIPNSQRKKPTYTINLPREVREQLRDLAAREYCPVSTIVRRALAAEFRRCGMERQQGRTDAA